MKFLKPCLLALCVLMTQFYAKSQSADVVSRAAYDSLLKRIEAVEAAQRDYANSDDVDGSTGATRGTQEKGGYKKKKSKVVLGFNKEYNDNEEFSKFRVGGYGEMWASYMDYGPNRFYAFHQPASRNKPGRFDFTKGDDVVVQIPSKGNVYEVRSGKYLGFTDTFPMKMVPGWSMIYAVLSKPVADVTLTGPKEAVCGEKASFCFAATGPEGAQTFHFALFGPDGSEIERCAHNLRTQANQGEYELFIPFNAAKGNYHVEITHTASKRKVTASFTVK